MYERNARSDESIARGCQADADELKEKFLAAGGEYHRIQVTRCVISGVGEAA